MFNLLEIFKSFLTANTKLDHGPLHKCVDDIETSNKHYSSNLYTLFKAKHDPYKKNDEGKSVYKRLTSTNVYYLWNDIVDNNDVDTALILIEGLTEFIIPDNFIRDVLRGNGCEVIERILNPRMEDPDLQHIPTLNNILSGIDCLIEETSNPYEIRLISNHRARVQESIEAKIDLMSLEINDRLAQMYQGLENQDEQISKDAKAIDQILKFSPQNARELQKEFSKVILPKQHAKKLFNPILIEESKLESYFESNDHEFQETAATINFALGLISRVNDLGPELVYLIGAQRVLDMRYLLDSALVKQEIVKIREIEETLSSICKQSATDLPYFETTTSTRLLDQLMKIPQEPQDNADCFIQ